MPWRLRQSPLVDCFAHSAAYPAVLSAANIWSAALAMSHGPPFLRSSTLPAAGSVHLPIDCRTWGLKTRVGGSSHHRLHQAGRESLTSSTSRERSERSVGKRRLEPESKLGLPCVWLRSYQHHGGGRPEGIRDGAGQLGGAQHAYL